MARPVETTPPGAALAAPLTREAPSGDRAAQPVAQRGAGAGRRIAIFADGADLSDILATYRAGAVQGFTTNPTLMRKSGVTDYLAFAKALLAEITDLPISFEVLADDFAEMERQARVIASWGENVYVKVPVTDTRGQLSRPVIANLVRSGVKVNVTALLTTE